MVSFSFRFVDKKNSLSSFQVLAQKVAQFPRSSAGNTKYLGINKQLKRTVSYTSYPSCNSIDCPGPWSIVPIIGSPGLCTFTCTYLNSPIPVKTTCNCPI